MKTNTTQMICSKSESWVGMGQEAWGLESGFSDAFNIGNFQIPFKQCVYVSATINSWLCPRTGLSRRTPQKAREDLHPVLFLSHVLPGGSEDAWSRGWFQGWSRQSAGEPGHSVHVLRCWWDTEPFQEGFLAKFWKLHNKTSHSGNRLSNLEF